MIGGGTSAWPPWGIWLFFAIAATAALVLLGLLVAFTAGFRQPSKRRTALIVLTVVTLGCWIGYRIVSNDRWAARSVTVDMVDALPSDVYDQRRSVSVYTRDVPDCRVHGALSSTQVRRSEPAPPYGEQGPDLFEAELRHLEEAANHLENAGYAVTRGVAESADGRAQMFQLLATNGDRNALILFDVTGVAIEAAANACNSLGIISGFAQELVGTVERFDPEAACAANTSLPPFPAACP